MSSHDDLAPGGHGRRRREDRDFNADIIQLFRREKGKSGIPERRVQGVIADNAVELALRLDLANTSAQFAVFVQRDECACDPPHPWSNRHPELGGVGHTAIAQVPFNGGPSEAEQVCPVRLADFEALPLLFFLYIYVRRKSLCRLAWPRPADLRRDVAHDM